MTDIRFELPEINTWRLFNKKITQRDVVEMVEAWETHGYRFGTVCMDDGWTVDGKLGDWVADPARFPDMPGLVDWIHRKGYAVRLWVAPLQMHTGTAIYQRAFPAAALKNKHGKPAFFTGLGTYRLDPRTEVGRAHIRDTMMRLTREYRVDAYKVDFPPFYVPHDDFYKLCEFAFTEEENKTMVPDFYRLVRESCHAVNPAVRIECACDLPGCAALVDDTISGDLVGTPRTLKDLAAIADRLKKYAQGHDLVPWFEMVWGEGSDAPNGSVAWHAGFLEYVALSINFGLKIEHSFPPFAYPNAAQIRCLTNLYGPRNAGYKVLYAGRKGFPVDEMLALGIPLNASTRFLVAPEEAVTVKLTTGPLKTNALRWQARNVFTDAPVKLRARNEFWSGINYCQVDFDAEARQVYELWHEGPEDPYFDGLYKSHIKPNVG